MRRGEMGGNEVAVFGGDRRAQPLAGGDGQRRIIISAEVKRSIAHLQRMMKSVAGEPQPGSPVIDAQNAMSIAMPVCRLNPYTGSDHVVRGNDGGKPCFQDWPYAVVKDVRIIVDFAIAGGIGVPATHFRVDEIIACIRKGGTQRPSICRVFQPQ